MSSDVSIIEIVMPAMEMAQDSATLIHWFKTEGEYVQKGDPLMQIETDKVSVDIEAPASGTLSNISAQPGDSVPVGVVIALLLSESEAVVHTPKSPIATAQRNKGESSKPLPSIVSLTSSPSPVAPRLPATSPKARRIAGEHQINLNRLPGSGPGGAVLSRDIPAETAERAAAMPPIPQNEYTVIPLKGIRKKVADKLQASYQSSPHISLTLSANMSETLRLLERLAPNIQSETGRVPTITVLLAKIIAPTLLKHPRLNAHLVQEEIREFTSVHLGIAVALDEGLIVPVIRQVERKGLAALQSELNDLSERARSGRLTPDQVKGSTFTLSNLGMFGIEHFTAILNPPEVGILSVGAIRQVPLGVGTQILLQPIMQLTLNADHRAVDGAVAAVFLKSLKEALENPHLLLM